MVHPPTRHCVAIASSGIMRGAVWPPVLHHFVATKVGEPPMSASARSAPSPWCAFAAVAATRATPGRSDGGQHRSGAARTGALGQRLAGGVVYRRRRLLRGDGDAQVHLVAYCGDLGYGVARGAEMLSLMLGFGFSAASRRVRCRPDRRRGDAAFGLDPAGRGVVALSSLRRPSLALRDLGLFGLFQGGIVRCMPSSCANIFAAGSRHAARHRVDGDLARHGARRWMSGALFDFTGSYRAAFVNGLIWNLLNVSIALWLLMRTAGGTRRLSAAGVCSRGCGPRPLMEFSLDQQ